MKIQNKIKNITGSHISIHNGKIVNLESLYNETFFIGIEQCKINNIKINISFRAKTSTSATGYNKNIGLNKANK